MKNTHNTQIGALYIVATPIGNLEDITLRALRILSEVSLVLCEDTRHTRILFGRHNITTKTESYHAHSNESKMKHIADMLADGRDLALVSDAGTPLVSDPGSPLIAYLEKQFGDDLRLVPIPGASALTAALSVVPVPSGRFTFLGFLPHKKGRQTVIKAMREAEDAQICYESSHRIMKMLKELEEFYPEARVVLARELTKQFEEILKGSPAELSARLEATPEKQKGEFVVIVSK
jgi:16S rRNA (cytidine1402-2'-O)-methyltransferase